MNVGNGVSAGFVQPRPAALPVSRRFVYVGNFRPHKNFPVLLQALRLRPQYRLHVVCPDPAEAHHLVLAAGLEQQVQVHCDVSDTALAELYASSCAVLIPSTLEGFGLPAVEAMRCGRRPVYWRGCGSVAEIAVDQGIGVAEHHDASQWAEAMDRAVESADTPVGSRGSGTRATTRGRRRPARGRRARPAGRSGRKRGTAVTRRVLFLSHTHEAGVFKVGSHHLARQFALAGYDVLHVSSPFSLVHRLRDPTRDPRSRYAASRAVRVDDFGVRHAVPRTVLPARFHPTGYLRRLLYEQGFDTPRFTFVDQPLMAHPGVCRLGRTTIYRPTDTYTGHAEAMQRRLLRVVDGVAATSYEVLRRLELRPRDARGRDRERRGLPAVRRAGRSAAPGRCRLRGRPRRAVLLEHREHAGEADPRRAVHDRRPRP